MTDERGAAVAGDEDAPETTRTRPRPAARPATSTADTADTADTAAAKDIRTPGRGALAAVSAAGVVFLAAAVVFAVLWLNARGSDGDRRDAAQASSAERARVLTVAQKAAIDFSSYDYRTLDTDFAAVEKQLTGSFARDYTRTSATLKATLSRYQAVGTAKVLDAGVSSLTASKAVVVVFLDQTVTSKVAKTPTVDRNRIRITLQRSGNRWLVSDLDLR